ncbi:MAG: dipeptide epimerase [Chitinophagaceae bacterium]|nr:dipeptide epimerase [Chitinophagaceae bacterium]MCW5905220.1 dipeptide epimerase [Chitinophagaceae bacterium]
MKLHYYTYNLPFQYPFQISGNRTKTHQPTLVVILELGNFYGIGEAPAIDYYNVTVDKMIATIESKKQLIEKFALTEPDRYWHYLHHLLESEPFLVAALDIAAWDLYGKMMAKKRLYEIWNTEWTNYPLTNYTIGLDSIENMLNKIKEHTWHTYKIKLGLPNDIEIITEIRKNTNAKLRVDVNGAWETNEALEKINVLKDLDIEFVEQPLAKDNWQGMKILFDKSPLPIIADESCVEEEDVAKCYKYFHGINIKLTKCSGISPALRMIEQAKSFGMKVMMGSMNESSIGTAAIAHFLPQLDYVDMDGPLLLTKDLATGLSITSSNVSIEGKYGLGIHPTLS